MRWYLWIWAPELGNWIAVGTSVDGVNDKIRQGVMRGLLRTYPGAVVYASHPESNRSERYFSPDGSSLIKMA